MRTGALIAALALVLWGCGAVSAVDMRPAPEFAHQQEADWLNSAPLTMKELRGKVVLLDVWTFG